MMNALLGDGGLADGVAAELEEASVGRELGKAHVAGDALLLGLPSERRNREGSIESSARKQSDRKRYSTCFAERASEHEIGPRVASPSPERLRISLTSRGEIYSSASRARARQSIPLRVRRMPCHTRRRALPWHGPCNPEAVGRRMRGTMRYWVDHTTQICKRQAHRSCRGGGLFVFLTTCRVSDG